MYLFIAMFSLRIFGGRVVGEEKALILSALGRKLIIRKNS